MKKKIWIMSVSRLDSYETILTRGEKLLESKGIMDFRNDAWLLFEHVFKVSRAMYFIKKDEIADSSLSDEYFRYIDIRCKHIPLQHITGHQEFMGFDFKVNKYTLIPRQDTEVLVEEALKVLGKYRILYDKNTIRVLDMCTGSGCIAISIAAMAEKVDVVAVDLSKKALEIAKENAIANSISNIKFIESNLFESLKDETFDIIISNPPYIKSKDIEELMPEVRDNEPVSALDGFEDGLYFYRNITLEASRCLEVGGYLLYEIGFDQAEDVKEIMKDNGFLELKVIKDLAGLNRVVIGRKDMY